MVRYANVAAMMLSFGLDDMVRQGGRYPELIAMHCAHPLSSTSGIICVHCVTIAVPSHQPSWADMLTRAVLMHQASCSRQHSKSEQGPDYMLAVPRLECWKAKVPSGAAPAGVGDCVGEDCCDKPCWKRAAACRPCRAGRRLRTSLYLTASLQSTLRARSDTSLQALQRQMGSTAILTGAGSNVLQARSYSIAKHNQK